MAAQNILPHNSPFNLTLSSTFIIFISLLFLQSQLVASSLQTQTSNPSAHPVSQSTIISKTSAPVSSTISSILLKNFENDSLSSDFNSTNSSAKPGEWFPGKDSSSSYSIVGQVIVSIILLSIIIGTIVGNILVCIAVCLVRKLRRPCNYLLVSLAVSDLCVAILVMPMAMMTEVMGNYWAFGPMVCDLWVSIDVLSCAASILNLCMISVDRYYAITKPLEYGVKRTPRRMIFCVFLVWLGAACISLPPLLILGNEKGEYQCAVCQNFGYQIYATLGSFYIPLIVMMVVYYKIFRAARKIVMEEKRAQSHLESHCYLEINVKNGGAAESKLLQGRQGSQPAARSSSTGTNSSVSIALTELLITRFINVLSYCLHYEKSRVDIVILFYFFICFI